MVPQLGTWKVKQLFASGNPTDKINDYSIKPKFHQTKTTAPLTFKFIEQCLNECIANHDDETQIIKYIKEKRATRIVPDIKRFYTK